MEDARAGGRIRTRSGSTRFPSPEAIGSAQASGSAPVRRVLTITVSSPRRYAVLTTSREVGFSASLPVGDGVVLATRVTERPKPAGSARGASGG